MNGAMTRAYGAVTMPCCFQEPLSNRTNRNRHPNRQVAQEELGCENYEWNCGQCNFGGSGAGGQTPQTDQ